MALAQGGPGIQGNWIATANTGAAKLRLFLKVAKAPDGSLSAKLDSIDQGAMDLPVSMVRQKDLAVHLELSRLGATYEGTLATNGSEMVGEWKQNGAVLPLTFQRVEKFPELSRPQEP